MAFGTRDKVLGAAVSSISRLCEHTISIRGQYSPALRDKTCETAENMVAFVKDLASRIGSIAPAFGRGVATSLWSLIRGRAARIPDPVPQWL
jgi:hypothetical protein